MNRRAFFGAMAVAPLVAPAMASAAVFKNGGRRVSCITGDPGERLFAQACGDGKSVKVYLDGVEQPFSETADEAEGFVTRAVVTENGNIAFNSTTEEVLRETIYGDVRIVIS